MAELNDLPELVRQFRLETVINQTKTIHTLLRGQRRLPSRVTWEKVTERPLGHGGYGEVWLERRVDDAHDHTSTPGLRAVKSIYTNASSQRREYIRELEALAKFSSNSHKYAHFFVQFYGWYESPGRLHAAMEYCEHGDLNKYIKSMGRLTEKETKDIIWQVLGGLSLMHEAKFAHRDIKPANILIKSRPPAEWWVKLCDLGLSKRAEDNASATIMRGTPGFMAPENLGLNSDDTNVGGEVDPFPADMWCLGETISHAVTGHGTFEPHASFYRYASGESDFPRASFRKHCVSEECIDFIQCLMSPRPKDRLLASQALDHPWIAIEDESDSDPILDVEVSPVTFSSFDGDEQSQHTQASAAWTQETAKRMDNSTNQTHGAHWESQDDTESVTIRMGMNSIRADTTATTKRNGEKRFSDFGSLLKIEDRHERSAEPDEDDHSQFQEVSRTKSYSEDSDRHENTPTNRTYMEDADEGGNPIEGTRIYPGKRPNNPVTRDKLFKQDETKLHSRTRSPSTVGHGQRASRQRTQNREVYSHDANTQHPVKTRPSSYAEFGVQSAHERDHDQSPRYLDTLMFEEHRTAYDTNSNRVWLADAFGNVHGLDKRSNRVNFSDAHSDQDNQETDTSVIDGTRSGSVVSGDARYIDQGAGTNGRFLRNDDSTGHDSNVSASRHRRRTDSEVWDHIRMAYASENVNPPSELQKWRKMPDNATQYCPSVSTISIINSEDEGDLEYAIKRIQRDFPNRWKDHPLGSSYNDTEWRGKRDPSITTTVPGKVRSISEGAETSIQGEKSPKKVRWDDDPRVGNIRRSEILNDKVRYRLEYPRRWWDF